MLNMGYTHFDTPAIPVPEGTKSGDPVIVGNYAGFALIDRQSDGMATVKLIGSAKDVTVTGALTVGQTVYLKTDGTLTATATGAKPFGSAVTAKGTGTGPAEVAPFGHNPAVAVAAA